VLVCPRNPNTARIAIVQRRKITKNPRNIFNPRGQS
jgi:hypothetical protein